MDEIICVVCNKPITGSDLDKRHWWHEPGCPNYGRNGLDESDEDFWCNCDIETHEGCIPDWAKEDWEGEG